MKYLAVLMYLSPLYLSVWGILDSPVWFIGAGFMVGFIAVCLKVEILPIVQKRKLDDANGRNSVLYVQMDPDAPMYKAVLAQELYECLYKVNPVNLLKSRSIEGQRELELMGHEIEVQAAVLIYGVKEAQYRRAEASSMQLGYECFYGMERYDIVEAMMAKTVEAQAWVARNYGRLA